MRHSARSGQARLHSRPGQPTEPGLPPGVHELAGAARPSRSGAPNVAALLFVPPSIAPDSPLLVFHGAGGAASSSLPLVRAAAARHGCLVLLPTSAARTWDLISSGLGADVERLDAALATVFGRFPVRPLAFGGFSDGASYALTLGLANGDFADAVMAFSPGFAAPPDRVGQPRVWISHGTDDAVLPIERCARPIAHALRESGYELRYEEFGGRHMVPPGSVDRALGWWLE